MGTDRLNGLALLNIHRDVRVDTATASIRDKLPEKPRRLSFRRRRTMMLMMMFVFQFLSLYLILRNAAYMK